MTELNVVTRFLSFDYERNGGPSRADYAETFDQEEASARAAALYGYLEGFIAENGRQSDVHLETLQDNAFSIVRSTGETLLVRCYGIDIFVLIRFPNETELADADSLFHELANDLDTDLMITLVRRFILTGNFNDDTIV